MKTIIIILIACISVGSNTNLTAQQKRVEKKDTLEYTTKVIEVISVGNYSAASDATFREQDIATLPKNSSQDLLRLTPGLVTAQHAGGGKAEQIFLRGFDCDHGTDININIDGAPVNMVSHGHGQGYADLHFVIPETIQRIDVMKGPYSALLGNQATAGAVSFNTYDSLPNNLLKFDMGMFSTYRGVGLLTQHIGKTHAYAGGEYLTSNGFFDLPQGFTRVNGILKTTTVFSNTATLKTSVMGFTSQWNASGQIPVYAVEQGLLSRFGSVDPNEGGNTSRLTTIISYNDNTTNPFQVDVSATKYNFRLFSNFTFFATDSIRGDMIEQTDNRTIVTSRIQKTFRSFGESTAYITKLGTNFRYDNINTALYHDSARVQLEAIRSSLINESTLGVFVEQSFLYNELSIIAGARGDVFYFNVHDKLQTPEQLNGQVATFIVSPKLTLNYDVSNNTKLYLNSGFGFHSNDARVVVSNVNTNTLPRAFGNEIGARWQHEFVSFSLAIWMLDLQSELKWVGDEGTTEQIGRTRRTGIDIEARSNIFSWLTVGTDVTLSHGYLRDEPETANAIPLAPTATLTSFCTVASENLTAAIRLRHISNRPANESRTLTATGYTVIDANATYKLTPAIQLQLQCENITNTQWRDAQFDTVSRLQNATEQIEDIHFTAGTPLNLKMGISFTL
ncbi:MAG: TonB-dependent receptor [Candidatus Kapabacteria bacterium]|nr:TonB-dependent receptor [Candidatus Kapabacteria bacterium]